MTALLQCRYQHQNINKLADHDGSAGDGETTMIVTFDENEMTVNSVAALCNGTMPTSE